MEGTSLGDWKLGSLILFSCLSTLFASSTATTNANDVSALMALRQEFGGNLNWPDSTDPCTTPNWQEVYCDSTNTRVTGLDLNSRSLVGILPPVIGSLSALQYLDMSFNPNLGGTLPTELGHLNQLLTLSLQGCSFTGLIPSSLSNMTKLNFLALNGNQLTGPIPPQLGTLSQLTWLDLSVNNLTGPLPIATANQSGLDQLQSAQHFHLNNNSFSGSIPPELGNGPAGLVHLLLDSNAFTGMIPESLGNLKNLTIINVQNNQLVGPIPLSLGNISSQTSGSLQQLRVANNQLNGTIPDLSALSSLSLVDFSNNLYAQQPYPAWLNRTTNLETIIMEKCNLVSPLPQDILSYPNLQLLNAAENALSGAFTIPYSIGPNVSFVFLQNNNITSFNQLNYNNFSRVQIQLAGNPVCAANSIANPHQYCINATKGLETWTSSLFQQNQCPTNFSCGLTLNLQNCSCATPLDLILVIWQPSFSVITNGLMEMLRTYIYTGLGLHSQQVWITNATFTVNGRVDVTVLFFPFDSSSSLDPVTVTNITSSFAQQKVNLYTFEPYFVAMGYGLLTASSSGKSSLSRGAMIGIIVGGSVIVLVLAALGIYVIMLKHHAKKMEDRQPFAAWGGSGGDKGEAPKLKGAQHFYFADLKKATNNFSKFNEIGAGGYGKVYKGTLPTGELVAVKRAQEESKQGAQEFKAEIEILSRVHHRNLVKLYGFCYEPGEQMLVYEFCMNGTLQEWLLGRMKGPLTWHRRLQIALGSARGLTYLHQNIDPPIIHRDVKSANILLDEKLTAKVADFGLSKLAPQTSEHHVQVSTQVKGTLGYLDPQYYTTHQLSDKSDVYSFGIVLLEILSARHPVAHGRYIVQEVRAALDKGSLNAVRSLLDPSLLDIPMQTIEPVLDLALMCVEEKSVDRPSMNEVVKRLEAFAVQNHVMAADANL